MYIHLVLAFNCSVNKKCNHSLWLSNICPSAKTFRPSASEITIIGINIINDLSPCNTPGYLPWTWMCFLPGNRGLLGGARRLPTSSSPSRLSWIGVPSCWWSLELKQICDAIWRNTFQHLADFANMVVLKVLPLESTWIEFMINYQIWFFYIEEQRSSSRNHIF